MTERRSHYSMAFGSIPSAPPVSHKLDAGKPMAGLMLRDFARSLQLLAVVTTHGAQKYTPSGWRHVPNGLDRYTDAMVRHQLAEATGEYADPDSGLSHAAHLAWNALARLELMLMQEEGT